MTTHSAIKQSSLVKTSPTILGKLGPMLRTVLAMVLLTFTMTAFAQSAGMRLGMYVVVDDLVVAKDFYGRLLNSEPVVENADFVGYSISGGLLGLYRETAFTHELRRGNNAVIYIGVGDIEAEFSRVQEMGATLVHEAIVREPYISLFMFEDPDGNAIEFYTTP
jgi:predicted enzyme related to lactoylglutathione lyase